MIRRFDCPPDPAIRYTHRPGAYGVLLQAGRVLLTQTDEYQLPGGGIDPGESHLQALHREVWEETGWHIANPVRIGAFRRFVFMPDYGYYAEKICHVYAARPTMKVSAPSEPGHRPVWMDAHCATSMLANEGEVHFLASFL